MPTNRFSHKETMTKPPSLGLSLIFILIQILLIGFVWGRLPPQIPLYYSLVYGFGRLANKEFIGLIPMFSLLTWFLAIFFTSISTVSDMYRHVQYWLIQLILLLQTIALVHIIMVIL